MSETWSPLRELTDIRTHLARALREAERSRARPGPLRLASAPPLDFSETPEAFIVRLDVPGAQRGDLQVTVHEGAVEIVGERPERQPSAARVLRAERARGAFRRRVPLPREADLAKVKASLADGVLTLRLPRRLPGGRQTVVIE